MDVQRTIYREDHEMFRTAVRRFLEREYLPRHARCENPGDVEPRVWLKAGREGLLCVTLPAEFGGGGDFGHAAVLREEFARAGVCDRAFSLHSDVIAATIAQWASEQQKRRWLPGVCSGEVQLALAVNEPGGKLRNLQTRALRDGDDYLISGSKTCVGNGMTGGLILLACRTGEDDGEAGISLIMVETDRPGVQRSRSPHRCEQPSAAELRLSNVRVPASHLLGEAGRGVEYLNRSGDQEHLLSAVYAASRLEHLLDLTLIHLRQPDGDGHCPWQLQHTRNKMAAIKARAVALRVLVDHYLDQRMRQSLSAEHAAVANLYASETLRTCADELSRLRAAQGRLRTHSITRAVVDHGATGKALHETIALAL
ncbi:MULTISPECIES: acyl-CoA dehydrogenase family protein [unclassified Pseudomonas]|jgi:alkylation response protein AidB-like acyl-CoA dehydrogenase|uniref:acyl-CoA dehydrogenase family protein n=1 Tax=unclassified Pseudomonas TaxID=196821 RepID=UPI00069F37FB|nr:MULTISPECIES: acyl-CoA dehydrogenase family protein [unclassified Pseudomonas]WPN44794.1 acyl-CoA dehydrogenase family protein [Pseudomonas sp. P8_241]